MEEKMCECGDLPLEDCMCDEFEETDPFGRYWNGAGLDKAFGGSDPD